MKVCAYCRREVENDLYECPYCGASEFIDESVEKAEDERLLYSDKGINESLDSMQHQISIENKTDKKESLIYRVVKYILLGILFYMLIMVVLVVILLIYVIITGNVPDFIISN